jgi:hypothetical protein
VENPFLKVEPQRLQTIQWIIDFSQTAPPILFSISGYSGDD